MNQQSEVSFLLKGVDERKQTVQRDVMGAGLRHREECEQRQEEGQEEEKWRVGHRLRRDGALPPGPVAERGVAAGDAH